MGICYEEGKGVVKDYVMAKQYYQTAASSNHASATNNLGFLLLLEKNFDAALGKFLMARALDSVDAIYNLGTMYEAGLGVTADLGMALKYYHESSEKGYAKSQVKLAHLYCQGTLLEVNYERAFDLFLKAAQQENDEGQNGLGQMFELGLGTKKSLKDAAHWYTKSASKGNPVACYNLGCLLETGEIGEAPNIPKAIKYLRDAERFGHPHAAQKLSELEAREEPVDPATSGLENAEPAHPADLSYSSITVGQ